MFDGVSETQYAQAVGSVQTQRKRRLIMHDNLTNSRGTNRMHSNSGQQQQDYDVQATHNFPPGSSHHK